MNEETKNGVLSPIQFGDIKKPGEVSDETFQRILKDTGGKAAIVMILPTTFTTVLTPETNREIHKFHIGAVNVETKFLPALLFFIVERLIGKHDGTLTTKTEIPK